MIFKNKTLLTTTSFVILSVLTMAPSKAADPMDQRELLSSHVRPSVQSAAAGPSSPPLAEERLALGSAVCSGSSAAAAAAADAPQPMIPAVAQGYEAIYQRFFGGKLIYRPNEGSDVGMRELRIAALTDPLASSFNLRDYGDTGKYLSISTGYRTAYNPENKDKIEIWIAPWFAIQKELQGPAKHYARIMSSWDSKQAPVGIFFNWGGSDDLNRFDYLTSQSLEDLSSSFSFRMLD